jgi:hypothetical protein
LKKFVTGTKNVILWGFAYQEENGELFWCGNDFQKNNKSVGYRIPVPVNATEEQLNQEFVLVSEPSNVPNLRAADITEILPQIHIFYCLHFTKQLEQTLNIQSKTVESTDELTQFENEVDFYKN